MADRMWLGIKRGNPCELTLQRAEEPLYIKDPMLRGDLRNLRALCSQNSIHIVGKSTIGHSGWTRSMPPIDKCSTTCFDIPVLKHAEGKYSL